MVAEAGIALIKLLLGLAVFATLGYLGRFYDKRIAGVLLTFPILNGIGILTGDDPLAVANSIYAVVVFNGLLLFLMAGFSDVVPPLPAAATPNVRLVARVAAWMVIWAIGAPLIVLYRDHLPGVAGLLLIQVGIAAVGVALCWTPPKRVMGPKSLRAHHGHIRALAAFWNNRDGALRLGLFALCCVILFVAARLHDSKWIGMLSALPLPGLFAVATLSVLEHKQNFDLIRDSVLIGPVTVITFNWLYAEAVFHMSSPHILGGFIALVAMLFANAVLIFWLVPRISVYLDRLTSKRQASP